MTLADASSVALEVRETFCQTFSREDNGLLILGLFLFNKLAKYSKLLLDGSFWNTSEHSGLSRLDIV